MMMMIDPDEVGVLDAIDEVEDEDAEMMMAVKKLDRVKM